MTVAFGVAEPGAAKSPRKSVLIGPDGKIAKATSFRRETASDHIIAKSYQIAEPN